MKRKKNKRGKKQKWMSYTHPSPLLAAMLSHCVPVALTHDTWDSGAGGCTKNKDKLLNLALLQIFFPWGRRGAILKGGGSSSYYCKSLYYAVYLFMKSCWVSSLVLYYLDVRSLYRISKRRLQINVNLSYYEMLPKNRKPAVTCSPGSLK